MPAVPDVNPDIMPVATSTVATAVLSLIHIPPVVEEDSVSVPPAQSAVVPEMVAGSGLIVTIVVCMHPDAEVYDITDVPAAMLL
jgi:hypothetical protein